MFHFNKNKCLIRQKSISYIDLFLRLEMCFGLVNVREKSRGEGELGLDLELGKIKVSVNWN